MQNLDRVTHALIRSCYECSRRGTIDEPLIWCNMCGQALYCNIVCQNRHLTRHAKFCTESRQAFYCATDIDISPQPMTPHANYEDRGFHSDIHSMLSPSKNGVSKITNLVDCDFLLVY